MPTLVIIALLAWLFPYALDYIAAEQTTRHAKEVEEEIDREGAAFTVSVREDADATHFAYILDQPLTPAEKKNLLQQDGDAVIQQLDSLAASHKGRGLQMPGLPESDGYTTGWLMDFFSDRAASLAITALRGKEIECKPATARTVVLIRPEGGGGYDGIHFNMSAPEVPVSLTPGNDMGKPYFSHRKIDLGNGATPGGLYVEVSSGIQDCKLIFEAEYRDAEGVERRRIRNGKDKFEVRGIPANPDQLFVVTLESVTDCSAGKANSEECPPLPFEKGKYTNY
ncbi:hypothetical protein G6W51_16405 [Streptomyces coelicolor]|uniref:hypothetical protein n=1 Tax=Streptomyces sp. SMS_SU21 TaxID=2069440 RepID=UPI0011B72090|nr:hypothetical protein [Streptomyces sp. SMS_SU21]MCA2204015.1 hypothetical protein [Streptomyces sp. SMS_SU21]NUV54461.1 hypothetical protein [Streptomyces coelicolor]